MSDIITNIIDTTAGSGLDCAIIRIISVLSNSAISKAVLPGQPDSYLPGLRRSRNGKTFLLL